MNGPLMPDEKELLIRLRSGEAEAFEVLYHRHKRRIFYNTLRLVHDRETAEELHQDVFLKIWERRDTTEPEKSFHFYLTRIAQNLAVDFYRKAARDKRLLEQLIKSAVEHYDPIESELHRKERHEALHHAIVKLPPQRQKEYELVA